MAIVRLKGLGKLKYPMTSPATFLLVALVLFTCKVTATLIPPGTNNLCDSERRTVEFVDEQEQTQLRCVAGGVCISSVDYSLVL
jgi:hypothetical protein